MQFVFMKIQTSKSVTVGVFLKMARKDVTVDLLEQRIPSRIHIQHCGSQNLSTGRAFSGLKT